jgi:hypothetical protein
MHGPYNIKFGRKRQRQYISEVHAVKKISGKV